MQELQPELVLVLESVPAQELALVPQLAQVLVLQPAQVLESQLALVQV